MSLKRRRETKKTKKETKSEPRKTEPQKKPGAEKPEKHKPEKHKPEKASPEKPKPEKAKPEKAKPDPEADDSPEADESPQADESPEADEVAPDEVAPDPVRERQPVSEPMRQPIREPWPLVRLARVTLQAPQPMVGVGPAMTTESVVSTLITGGYRGGAQPPPPPTSAWRLVRSGVSTPINTMSTTITLDTTGANRLVIVAAVNSQYEALAMSDSLGNTFWRFQGVGTYPSLVLMVTASPTTGPNHTITLNTAPNEGYPAMLVYAFYQQVASVYLQYGAEYTNSLTGTVISAAQSLPVTISDSLVMSGLCTGSSAGMVPVAAPSGYQGLLFSMEPLITYGAGAAYRIIDTVPAAEQPSWTVGVAGTLRTSVFALTPP